MSSSYKSNFQRTQSKVWWGAIPERDHYGFVSLPEIKSPKLKKQIHTPPEISTTSWSYRRGSPGSLKSHDSGFSDSDNSPPAPSSSSTTSSTSSPTPSLTYSDGKNYAAKNNLDKFTPKKSVNHQINEVISERSPPTSVSSDRSTPPTVIRKKIKTHIHPDTCRRISFSAPTSPIYERIDPPSLIHQIDSMTYATTSPITSTNSLNVSESNDTERCKCPTKDRSIKRGKVVTRRSSDRKLLKCMSQLSVGSANDFYQLADQRVPSSPDHNSPPSTPPPLAHLEEEATVMQQKAIPQTPKSILKASTPKSYNNETIVFGTGGSSSSPKPPLPTYAELFPTKTSTPNAKHVAKANRSVHVYDSLSEVLELSATMNWDTCTYIEYTNPLLNGHSSSVQFWLDETRSSYCHEVLSTLQTKSVSQTAVRYTELNSAMAGKLIRQLQSKSLMLQYEFEALERMRYNDDDDDGDELLKSMPDLVTRLHASVMEFVQKLGIKKIFRNEKNVTNIQFKNNVAQIIDMSYDLVRAVAPRSTDLDPAMLIEDIQILKRYLLITVRMVFEKLMRIIIDRIEDSQCNLILRSNLSMVAMLSNMEYTGFASLNDAFLATDAVKVLLVVCAESNAANVRALALRALATICSSNEAIRQFEAAGGTEILKEILTDEIKTVQRSDPEIREALSAFTQVTAPWHGKDHSLSGLKDMVESLVEYIANLAVKTNCCQTLLLAVAALNNLSRMETNSIYSLMSNETILKLKGACEARGPGASIFLYVSFFFFRLFSPQIDNVFFSSLFRNNLFVCY